MKLKIVKVIILHILVTCNNHDLTDKREADGTLIFFTVRDIYIPFVYSEQLIKKCECVVLCMFHYGPQVMKFEPAPIIRPICFYPLVTVLTGFHCTCFSLFSGNEI